MENRKRMTYILIAGTLTAFILAIFVAFRGSGETASAAAGDLSSVTTLEDNGTTALLTDQDTDIAALQAQIESLQEQNSAYAAQNDELRAAVTTLQERESEFQAQIESANQTITELSAQSGGFGPGGFGPGGQSFGEGMAPDGFGPGGESFGEGVAPDGFGPGGESFGEGVAPDGFGSGGEGFGEGFHRPHQHTS